MTGSTQEWTVSNIGAAYDEHPVLFDISFELEAGETMALLGHNGAGKSTLMKLLYGMLKPTSGTILYRGSNVDGMSTFERMRAGISYMPEGKGVFPNITVEDNLRLGLVAFDLDKAEMERRVERVVAPMPILREFFRRKAGLLSGGQQQMLSLARTLAGDPKCLLLDEPSIGLVPKLFQDLLKNILAFQRDMKFSLILVEQNVQSALRVADKALVLKAGRVIYAGAPAEIADRQKLMELY